MEVTTRWEEKGRQEERQIVALKMLSENLDLETIARFTGVTIEQLRSLQTASQPST
jgi:predicted transposase YdaD